MFAKKERSALYLAGPSQIYRGYPAIKQGARNAVPPSSLPRWVFSPHPSIQAGRVRGRARHGEGEVSYSPTYQ